MKKTYEQVLAFDTVARGYLERAEGQKTKLAYAIERVQKSYAKQAGRREADYRERLEDIDVEHCSVDEHNNIVSPYAFTKDAQRMRLADRRKASADLFASEVDVESYMATSLHDDLTDAEREAFAGFVLPEQAGEEALVGPGIAVHEDGRLCADEGQVVTAAAS